MYRILICDDDRDIVAALKIYLSGGEYQLYAAYTGKEALDIVQREDIQLILMDIMMPELDGIAATAKIREVSNVPIILLTAKSETSDKILGLNIGADDYITKPFDPMEVLARVRSQLRRYTSLGSANASQDVITIGAVSLDDPAKTVTVDGEPVSLTPSEYGILRLLMQHPGQVFSSAKIYESVWNETGAGSESAVAVQHPPSAGENRDQPLGAPVYQGRLGPRVQIRPHGPGRVGGRAMKYRFSALPWKLLALLLVLLSLTFGFLAAIPRPGVWPGATMSRTPSTRPPPAATIWPRVRPIPSSPGSGPIPATTGGTSCWRTTASGLCSWRRRAAWSAPPMWRVWTWTPARASPKTNTSTGRTSPCPWAIRTRPLRASTSLTPISTVPRWRTRRPKSPTRYSACCPPP